MVSSGYLPELVLRAHKEEEKLFRLSHEGIFSSDFFERPEAMVRLFRQIGIDEEEVVAYLWMVGFSGYSQLQIKEFMFPLVEQALELPSGIISKNLYVSSRDQARPIFYKAVQEYTKRALRRNLEFWNLDDKGIYNTIFGEFNFAWMSVLDIFESPEFNGDYRNFKRIFPEDREDLGMAVYTPNKVGPEGSIEVDLRDGKQVPSGSIIVYRVGSGYTKGKALEGETRWDDLENAAEDLLAVDGKPGHVEACVYSEGANGNFYCSDGRKDKPATEWSLDREIFAIYLPVESI
ncbi:hypothetical protein GW915_04695 [bacterium]|nr:hypothetical protein [bacterium]